jgi:hypothetical protein
MTFGHQRGGAVPAAESAQYFRCPLSTQRQDKPVVDRGLAGGSWDVQVSSTCEKGIWRGVGMPVG